MLIRHWAFGVWHKVAFRKLSVNGSRVNSVNLSTVALWPVTVCFLLSDLVWGFIKAQALPSTSSRTQGKKERGQTGKQQRPHSGVGDSFPGKAALNGSHSEQKGRQRASG